MMLDDSAIGKMINHFWEIPEEKIREFIRRNSLGIADVEELFSMEEVFGAVLSGNAVFFMDGYDRAMKISSKGYPGLDVSEAETEKVLRGSKEGFCDSVKTNAALVRKRIRDTRLKVEQQNIGVRSNTVVQLLYVEDLVHEELLIAVKERLGGWNPGQRNAGAADRRSLVFAFSTVSDNRTSGPGGTGTSQWKSRAAL